MHTTRQFRSHLGGLDWIDDALVVLRSEILLQRIGRVYGSEQLSVRLVNAAKGIRVERGLWHVRDIPSGICHYNSRSARVMFVKVRHTDQ